MWLHGIIIEQNNICSMVWYTGRYARTQISRILTGKNYARGGIPPI